MNNKNLRKISTLDKNVILHGESSKIFSYLRNFAVFLDGMKNSGKNISKEMQIMGITALWLEIFLRPLSPIRSSVFLNRYSIKNDCE